MKTSIKLLVTTFFLSIIAVFGCSEKDTNSQSNAAGETKTEAVANENGIGPISSLVLPAQIDQAMADNGANVFTTKCSACHKVGKRFIGPDLTGLLERRTPAWAMNMILNPTEMTEKDPTAKQLLIEYNGAPMANQNLTEEDARAVVEYIRTLKSN